MQESLTTLSLDIVHEDIAFSCRRLPIHLRRYAVVEAAFVDALRLSDRRVHRNRGI